MVDNFKNYEFVLLPLKNKLIWEGRPNGIKFQALIKTDFVQATVMKENRCHEPLDMLSN